MSRGVASRRLRLGGWEAPLVVLICLVCLIGALRPSLFTMDQFAIKVAAALTLILVATGETIVVLRGGIDLSVGGILSVATAVAATRGDPGPLESLFWMAFILLLGGGIGMLNGVLISVLRLQPFLVTLATWSIVEGAALIVLPSEGGTVPGSWVRAG